MADIKTLFAYNKSTNEVLFASGIEDDHSTVEIYLDKDLFTSNDFSNMSNILKANFDMYPYHSQFSLGQNEAKDCVREFDNVSIVIKNVSIPDNFNEL